MARLILASSSPRRRELLEQLGLVFDIYSPDIDESVQAGESVADYVERLACAKAEAVQLQYPDAIVIAADTSLGVDQEILGKPESKQHAFEMWEKISGRKHDVYTAVCVRTNTQISSIVVRTEVEFQHLSPTDMEAYWATSEHLGKAGAYAMQERGSAFVKKINGAPSTVVGLPIWKFLQEIKRFPH